MITKEMIIKNIIFDFGGVIIDIDANSIVNQMNKMGFEYHDKIKSPAFKKILDRFEKGIITASTFRKQVCNYLEIKITDHLFDEIWNSMLFDIPERRINLVKQLKQNYHVYLLSNTNAIHYDMFVRDLQLRFGYREFDNLFDKSFFSFVLHIMKPDPDIFIYICDHYHIIPEESLFIDDTEANLVAARKLGFHTYKINQGERVVELFKDGKIRDDIELDG